MNLHLLTDHYSRTVLFCTLLLYAAAGGSIWCTLERQSYRIKQEPSIFIFHTTCRKEAHYSGKHNSTKLRGNLRGCRTRTKKHLVWNYHLYCCFSTTILKTLHPVSSCYRALYSLLRTKQPERKSGRYVTTRIFPDPSGRNYKAGQLPCTSGVLYLYHISQ